MDAMRREISTLESIGADAAREMVPIFRPDFPCCALRDTTGGDLDVRKVNHRWAGLRSFAPDRTFVVGFDPRCTGFFWLAGQGGYGVQSAPGMAQLCAHLITGTTLTGSFAGLDRFTGRVAVERLLACHSS